MTSEHKVKWSQLVICYSTMGFQVWIRKIWFTNDTQNSSRSVGLHEFQLYTFVCGPAKKRSYDNSIFYQGETLMSDNTSTYVSCTQTSLTFEEPWGGQPLEAWILNFIQKHPMSRSWECKIRIVEATTDQAKPASPKAPQKRKPIPCLEACICFLEHRLVLVRQAIWKRSNLVFFPKRTAPGRPNLLSLAWELGESGESLDLGIYFC